MTNNGKKRWLTIILVATVVGIILGNIISNSKGEKDDRVLNYAEVIVALKNEEVEKISAFKDSHTFTIFLKGEGDESELENMYTTIVPNIDDFTTFVAKEIEEGNPVEFEIKEPNTFTSIIVSLVTPLISCGLIFIMFTRMTGGGGMKIQPINSSVKFYDVAGIDEEKSQVEEIVEFLRNPEKYRSIGAKIPKGVLLSGDPGTGKTLLAKAIAGEAGVPFFQINGSSFEEKFVGVGASRVRKLFSEAKKCAPSIIFIDEIDSVAQSRYGSKATYSEQTLNQLLSEMDGFETTDNVIVIAATNHIDILDPAIRRPGRFDRTVYIPNPDVIARRAILEVHARNKRFAQDVSLVEVAKKTVGFSGASLENILNEAAIYAVNQGRQEITQEDINEAIARIFAGLEKKNSAITNEEKWLTAVHEAGHAVASALVRPDVKIFEISIVPRGDKGGYNFFDDTEGRYLQKKTIIKKLKVAYGGRIAEELLLGDISSGAVGDYENASNLAHNMVVKYAMSENFLTKIQGEDEYNAQLESGYIEKAQEICKRAFDDAKELLKEHEEDILSLAEILFEKEYISQEEIKQFFESRGI